MQRPIELSEQELKIMVKKQLEESLTALERGDLATLQTRVQNANLQTGLLVGLVGLNDQKPIILKRRS